MSEITGSQIQITGIVQGVGFRPFVYTLARQLGLTGWVKNTSAGVVIEIDGSPHAIMTFLDSLKKDAPVLARIDSLAVENKQPGGYASFQIIESETLPSAFQPISPDICICPDCLRELYDPFDRRYRYPFINCTNCGPRFTIIEDIPYDRPNTTMAKFPLCPACEAEYQDPGDRRFHAQPVACPVCGPKVWLESTEISFDPQNDPIIETQKLLSEGFIIAIKGLGGFHLACDATNSAVVAKLRNRKLRVDKPFAVMFPDLPTIEQHCLVNPEERELLTSPQRPIVILERRHDCTLPENLTPGQKTLGVMLPYTPLHYLLFSDSPNICTKKVLVMTSGNISEEPIAINNGEAIQRLRNLADAFLLHNRDIRTRCDDSVYRIVPALPRKTIPIRRSRGYAPLSIHLQWESVPLLAVGAELKNTFCMVRDSYAFLSHHIGDMENLETFQSFEDGINQFQSLFRINPEALVYDLHPDYLATRYAQERARSEQLPLLKVQHHHAHIASCMADNGCAADQTVIGIALDGTGYGEDGSIWGGELLLASYAEYHRIGHLRYFPLPGGDASIRNPARIALAYLWNSELEWDENLPAVSALPPRERQALLFQLENNLNTPQTSSMGRLFDAVAALIGLRAKVNYEAQAAIELEALADPEITAKYPYELNFPQETSFVIDPRPLLKAVVQDFLAGKALSYISACFHNAITDMLYESALYLHHVSALNTIALSGGVWQNRVLLEKITKRLSYNGFSILTHHQVPPNDGGVSLGQAASGYQKLIGSK